MEIGLLTYVHCHTGNVTLSHRQLLKKLCTLNNLVHVILHLVTKKVVATEYNLTKMTKLDMT